MLKFQKPTIPYFRFRYIIRLGRGVNEPSNSIFELDTLLECVTSHGVTMVTTFGVMSKTNVPYV